LHVPFKDIRTLEKDEDDASILPRLRGSFSVDWTVVASIL